MFARHHAPPDLEEWLLLQLSGDLFVDIGAFEGDFSILLHKQFVEVYAVEPHPENFRRLSKRIAKTKAWNVQPIRLAVSDETALNIPLFLGNQEGTHSLLGTFAGGSGGISGDWRSPTTTGVSRGDTMLVDTITLKDLLLEKPEADLVKVDVEGAEWSVLRGAEPIIGKIKRWLIEVHARSSEERELRKQEIEKWLRDRGYRTMWIDDKHIYAKHKL